MANIFKEIYDQLISLIDTEWVRFKDPGRCMALRKVTNSALGYEDCIIVRPSIDTPYETLQNLSGAGSSKISRYRIDLVYFKKSHEKDEYETITEFAEALDNFLIDYTDNSTYWIGLETSIEYDIDEEIPEDYQGNLQGFVMDLSFIRWKQ